MDETRNTETTDEEIAEECEVQALVPQSIQEYNFYGDVLQIGIIEGKAYIALRPIVDNLELNWSPQRQRTLRDLVLKKHIRQMTWRGADGRQRAMLALPLEFLAGWLFGLTSGKSKPEQAEKITRYREKCFVVLWEALQRGELTTGLAPSLDQPGQQTDVLLPERREIAHESPEQTIVLEPEEALIQPGQYGYLVAVMTLVQEHLEILLDQTIPFTARLDGLAIQLAGTDSKVDQVLALLYQFAGQQEQQQQRLDKIDERTKRLTPKHERMVADLVEDIVRRAAHLDVPLDHFKVYGRLKHKFGVNSFKEIDDDRFENVMEFLRDLQSKALGGDLPRQGRLL